MSLWLQVGSFPIKFEELEALKDHDETEHYVQSLNKLTPIIADIFQELTGVNGSSKSPRALQKEICEFLCSLEPHGFLLFLGVRRTIGSSQDVLPPEREDLEHMYNRLNKPLTDEELRSNPNPSVLTVGARAV